MWGKSAGGGLLRGNTEMKAVLKPYKGSSRELKPQKGQREGGSRWSSNIFKKNKGRWGKVGKRRKDAVKPFRRSAKESCWRMRRPERAGRPVLTRDEWNKKC